MVVFPLFPQYAASSTGSALEAVFGAIAPRWNVPPVSVVPPFYDEPGFIAAFAAVGAPVVADARPDHVLFSFHGLPERHMRKSDESGSHCLTSDSCCDRSTASTATATGPNAYATARAWPPRSPHSGHWTVTSSRGWAARRGSGPTPTWSSRSGGRRHPRLVVFSPAFVADCLETLEEIGIRGRAQFLAPAVRS